MRPRRSVLACPGSNPRMMERAAGSDADEVFLDLEDAVAPGEKAAARATIVTALRTHDFGRKIRCVRINQVDSPFALRDILEVVEGAGDHLDALMVPKVQTAGDVAFVDRALGSLEGQMGLERPIGLEVQLEDGLGLTNIAEIAQASPRVEALIFGPGDFAAALRLPQLTVGEMPEGYPGDLWHYALFRIVVTARAFGLAAVDGPFAAIRDLDGLRRSASRSAALGFDGKWALHPTQIGPLNEVYSPTPAQFARAREILEAYRRATQEDRRGAVMLGDEMIDEASRKMAAQLYERGRLVGMEDSAPRD